jgi:UDP:flavonoid glycosyltransferase YjiC (YdhE family)
MGQGTGLPQQLPMRPDQWSDESGETPPWIAEYGADRPGIYVTAGTTPIVTNMAPWHEMFEALGSLDVDVLATIGPVKSIDDLGPIPANVRIERFVAQAHVLPRTSVVVTHAGAGTMLAAARRGIAQLSIPTWADQWENADAIARTGSGITLEENERDAASILNAVNTLIEDDEYRGAAKRLTVEITAMPSPRDHVATIERIVAGRR